MDIDIVFVVSISSEKYRTSGTCTCMVCAHVVSIFRKSTVRPVFTWIYPFSKFVLKKSGICMDILYCEHMF